MKLTNSNRSFNRPPDFRQQGVSLIEMMVYLGAFAVLTSVGFTAFYRCMENSRALQRNADEIVNTMHAGENWRLDVRAARGNIRLETSSDEQVLYLPGPDYEVSYRFATNTVFRRLGNNGWSTVLDNVQACSFVARPRQQVSAWQWELELKTRSRSLSRIKPLFTFIAVPSGPSK